jgi:hypothetical protein
VQIVAPPPGSALLLEAVADGVQIYACEAQGSLFHWTFKGPEANLFDKQGRQIGTHFAGPTWKMADGSAIVGEVIAKADAPEKNAIQWLLLRPKPMKGRVSSRMLPLSAGSTPKAESRRQPAATRAISQSRRECGTPRLINSSARQRIGKGG